MINYLSSLNRTNKIIFLVSIDFLFCVFSMWLSYSIRYEEIIIPNNYQIISFLIAFIYIPIFFYFKFYNYFLRFFGNQNFRIVLFIFFIYALLFTIILIFVSLPSVPRSIGLIHSLIFFIFFITPRVIYVDYFNRNNKNILKDKNSIIFGTDENSIKLSFILNYSSSYNFIGFCDLEKKIHNINNYNVFSEEKIISLIRQNKINYILLLKQNYFLFKNSKIYRLIEEFDIKVLKIENTSSIIDSLIINENNSNIDFESLFRRQEINVLKNNVLNNVNEKTILVTGAAGSIGGEICNQILKLNPKKVVMLDHSEFSLFNLKKNLSKINDKNLIVEYILGDIKDNKFIEKLFLKFKFNTVFHSAAYKHVDFVEDNPAEGVKNNIFGTINILNQSIQSKVSNFCLISSDKAVMPKSLMGITKRISEIIVKTYSVNLLKNNDIEKFRYSIVRFGNVLNSSGSVIPIFIDQIKNGGPVIVRDINAERYFMTIQEAATLVIYANSFSNIGEIFFLDMGKRIKIYDLAKKLIRLYSNNLNNKKIEIKITKLNKGEKIIEQLNITDEVADTRHPKIKKIISKNTDYETLLKDIVNLEKKIYNDDDFFDNLLSIINK